MFEIGCAEIVEAFKITGTLILTVGVAYLVKGVTG
jgi:hypothetical protein